MVEFIENYGASGITLPNPTGQDDAVAAFKRIRHDTESTTSNLINTIPALMSEATDIASASLGFTERDDISRAISSEFPGLREFILRNRGALEGVTGLASVFLSVIPAGKVTQTAGPVTRALKMIPGVGRVTTWDQRALKARAALRLADRKLAAEGLANSAAARATVQFENTAILDALNIRHAGGVVQRNVIRNASRKAAFKRGAAQGAAAEGIIFALGNENEFLYSENTGTNLFLASVGVVLPGTFDMLGDAYQMRRWLNSDRVNQLADNAVDVGGYNKLADEAIAASKDVKVFGMHGTDTDTATHYALAARAKATGELGEDVSHRLFAQRRSAGLEDTERAHKFLERVTRDGLGIRGTEFSLGSTSFSKHAANHVKALTHVDPTVFYGAEAIGKIPAGTSPQVLRKQFDEVTEDLRNQAEKLFKKGKPEDKAAAEQLVKHARFRESLEWVQARNMELVPLDDTLGIKSEFSGEIVREGNNLWQVKGSSIGVTDGGAVVLPQGKKIESLEMHEAQGLYFAADRMLDAVTRRKSPTITMSKKPTWFELDVAEEFLVRTEGRGVVRFPGDMTRSSAQVESLAQKVDIIKRTKGKVGLDLALREKLNLPRLTSYERGLSGVDDTALDMLIAGVKDGQEIRTYDSEALKAAIGDFKRATDLAEYSSREVSLSGNSFKLGQDFAGNPIESFVVLKRPPEPEFFSRVHLEKRIAAGLSDVVASLTSAGNKGTFAQAKTLGLLASHDYKQAINTSRINDMQAQGLLPVGNKTAITSFDFAFRDNPVLLAAQRIQDTTQKETSAFFNGLLTTPVKALGGKNPSQVFTALRSSKRNLKSSQLLDQFISARRGWDLEAKTVDRGDGLVSFQLAKTDKNARRWQQMYGTNMPKGALMQHANGQVVSVDQLALEGLKAFQHLSDSILKENNALLRAKGLGEINRVDWYVPARDMSRKNVQFIVDGNGNTVQSLVTNSDSEMQQLIRKLEKDPDSLLGPASKAKGFRLVSNDQVDKWASLWDRAYTGLNDPSIPVVQIGSKNKGSAQSPIIEFGAWEEGIETFQRQFHRLGNDIIENIMAPQIRAAKSRASAQRGDTNVRNIHDYYIDALLGKNPLNAAGSRVGRIFKPLEDTANAGLAKLHESVTQSGLNPFKGGVRQAAKDYERLVKEIEGDLPFKDVNDFIEQKFSTRTPPVLREVAGKVNALTAGLVLRWLESAHAILNITGMINTSPAVINYFTPRAGESIEAFANRIGHSATVFGKQAPIGILDMPKIMHRATQRAWKGDKAFSEAEWKYMRQHGYLDQEVAEFQRQLAAMGQSDDALSRFWKGDINAPKGSLAHRGAEGWISILSDKSEQFSRTYAHMVGLDLAENVLGITSMQAKHVFAHDVANKVIANYNPLNRPEIFQGGIGTPIGLFQSYMFNYYQRLYRYMETGDMKSMALQMSMQAGMFGMATVPGWREYNDIYNWTEDGKTNPYDGLYNRFGREVGDLISAGTLSNLPKLAGLDGAALYTRGDTAPRLPGADPFPALQVAQDFFGALGRGVDLFRADNPGITHTQVVEVMNQMIPNRPISGLLDVYLGYSADKRGNMISNDVRQGANAIYRIMGLKPLTESKTQEAYYSNRRQNELQLAKRTRLLREGRAALRSGSPDALPKLIERYLETGGNPAYVKQWMQTLILSADTPQAELQLFDVLGSVDKMNQQNRLMNAMSSE